ncbi:MAG: hypothetical protein G01um101431_936 [Parcubacteria group bacterium Gr01-1014_31]|nr:MAG: hypothetical protein G01um101431_936 [Parcubacteria group bacterium Gr01-1014_31]
MDSTNIVEDSEQFDWRTYNFGKLPKKLFPEERRGDKDEETVVVAGLSNMGYGLESIIISFPIPSITAMMLNVSYKSWQEGENLLNAHNPYTFSGESTHLTVPIEKTGKLFDAIEKLMQGYIFAYSAIEHFANQSLPDDYKYSKERREGTEIHDKHFIERNVTLDEKLGAILSEIYNVESIKTKEIWQKYIWLKNTRDNLIHFKSKDFYPKNWQPTEKYLWNELVFAVKKDNPAIISKKVIGYYLSSTKDIPHWFTKCPF